MTREREFRLFVKAHRLIAMSQRYLDNYLPKIEKRKESIWLMAGKFIKQISNFLPDQDIVMDTYLNSVDQWMIIDLNPFGPETDSLLLRNWDWNTEIGLKLISKPTQMKGRIEVSF